MSTVSVSATSTLLASGIFASEPGQRLLHILEVLGKRGFRALYDKCNGDASSSYYQTGLQRVHLWSANVIDEDIDFVRRTCPDVDETYESCFVRYVADRYRGQSQRPTVRCPPLQDFARRFLEALGQHDSLVTGDYFARRDAILVRVACMDAARQAMYTLVTTENVRVELVSEVGGHLHGVAPSSQRGGSVVSSTAPSRVVAQQQQASPDPRKYNHPLTAAPPAPASPPPRSVAASSASHRGTPSSASHATSAPPPPPQRAPSSVASSARARSIHTRNLSDLSERDEVLPSDSVSQVGHGHAAPPAPDDDYAAEPPLPPPVPPHRQATRLPHPPPSSYEDDDDGHASHASRASRRDPPPPPPASHVSDARSYHSSVSARSPPGEQRATARAMSTQTTRATTTVDDRHDFTMISHRDPDDEEPSSGSPDDDDELVQHPSNLQDNNDKGLARTSPPPTLPTARQHTVVTMQQDMPSEPVYSRASSNASSVRIGMKKVRSPR